MAKPQGFPMFHSECHTPSQCSPCRKLYSSCSRIALSALGGIQLDGSAVYVKWLSAFGSAVYSGLSALLGGTRVEATGEVEVPSCTSSAFLQPSQLRSGVPSIGAEPFKPFLLLVFTPVFRGVPPLQDTITLSSSKFPRIPRVSLKIKNTLG